MPPRLLLLLLPARRKLACRAGPSSSSTERCAMPRPLSRARQPTSPACSRRPSRHLRRTRRPPRPQRQRRQRARCLKLRRSRPRLPLRLRQPATSARSRLRRQRQAAAECALPPLGPRLACTPNRPRRARMRASASSGACHSAPCLLLPTRSSPTGPRPTRASRALLAATAASHERQEGPSIRGLAFRPPVRFPHQGVCLSPDPRPIRGATLEPSSRMHDRIIQLHLMAARLHEKGYKLLMSNSGRCSRTHALVFRGESP
jgi:hypothetical protein